MLTNGVVASKALYVVAELGVADHLGDETASVEELAGACDADPDGLNRLLRLLTSHGIFEWHINGYRHTAASRLLRSDHPMSMRAFSRMMGLPIIQATFDQLEHSGANGFTRHRPSPGRWTVAVSGGTSRPSRDLRPSHDRNSGR